jgi:O-acetyl-ADP-ribose deacetylase (regulator of RNase III)
VEIEIVHGSITDIKVDGIINAANGLGIMGAGVAGAIGAAAGSQFRNHVRAFCKAQGNYKRGTAYTTYSGALLRNGVMYVTHAVTMDTPGGETSIIDCSNAFTNALLNMQEHGLKTIATPALGTGVGGLNKQHVAEMIVGILLDDGIEWALDKVYIVDLDEQFLSHARIALHKYQVQVDE